MNHPNNPQEFLSGGWDGAIHVWDARSRSLIIIDSRFDSDFDFDFYSNSDFDFGSESQAATQRPKVSRPVHCRGRN